jgi:hypothetical protein
VNVVRQYRTDSIKEEKVGAAASAQDLGMNGGVSRAKPSPIQLYLNQLLLYLHIWMSRCLMV